MDGREFMRVAEALVLGPTEAEWRSAVGRAYYAAFHVARNLLRDCRFIVPRDERAHAYLIRRLSNAGHGDVMAAGRNLDDLRSHRNTADYDLGPRLSQANVSIRVLSARNIIRTLDRALSEPLKSQITEAMKLYERDVLKEVTWQA